MTAKIASKTRIYRDMKKFLNEVIYIIKDFPKDQRFAVGDRIERTAIDSLHTIAKVYKLASWQGSRSRIYMKGGRISTWR